MGGVTYVENRQGLLSTRSGVLLSQGDELLRQSLGLLGLGPCGGDGFVGEERGDEVAEQGLPVRGLTAEMAVLCGAPCHG